jgi:hypothetical protein
MTIRISITKESLKKLEHRFKCSLPKEYKKKLLQPPKELLVGYGSGEQSPANTEFLLSHSRLIQENQTARNEIEWYDRLGNERRWPNRYFVIGVDGQGNLYSVDTTRDSQSVYFFDHEEGTFSCIARTFKSFFSQIVANYESWAESETQKDEEEKPTKQAQRNQRIAESLEGQLFSAIQKNDIKTVRKLVQQVDPNVVMGEPLY